ncbi:MAG: DUF4437 domain-containing protein [Alphaproteobacteria bacterium]|nr:DUF4437 domain-containing protein [Alphaproteobacteria bacterium]
MSARKTKPMIGLREFAAAIVIGVFAIAPATAFSKSITAVEHEIGVPVDDLNWVPFAGGTGQMALLWENTDSGEYAMLLKLPSGWTPGAHSHSAAYYGVTLQGNWVHTFGDGDSRTLPPGSYVVQPGEAVHDDACAGPEDCILLIHQHKPFDFTLAHAATD